MNYLGDVLRGGGIAALAGGCAALEWLSERFGGKVPVGGREVKPKPMTRADFIVESRPWPSDGIVWRQVANALEDPGVLPASHPSDPFAGFGYDMPPTTQRNADLEKLERWYMARVSETRTPEEYTEVYRRYELDRRALGAAPTHRLDANPLEVRRMDELELTIQGLLAHTAMLGGPREEYKRVAIAEGPQGVPPAEPVGAALWPYDPDAPVGDGDRGYLERFKGGGTSAAGQARE